MTTEPTTAARATEPQDAPQLRTILLTDLVESTALVERLGDGPAADLFRAHDRLVLRLQNHWRGRLIDRSDGLLLLFERPIDGLGFALDYFRGLVELGAPHGADLKARAGLHVGEVLSWRNSDEAVRVGAKPVEVEGLAKPMAARLMTMALPGQLLMSAVAETLAHRAARELGERGQHLLWKSHGHWRFKGVPQPQQVFEVGEPGLTPLRTPQNGPKAWRDIPLWRRPAALVAELALVVMIGFGTWLVVKPQPAIAFNERDWVVVADLRNLTGDTRYDDALEAALRIGLEQSHHVNVVSDARVADILAQMDRDPAAVEVDRNLASEVAIRGGIRAVLLPTVSDAGGPVRVDIEVVDPHTQATVYAASAQGQGAKSAVASMGQASEALRAKLGEGLEAIQANSKPLAQVTTANLDALRAFTLGNHAYARQQLDEAEQHFNQALDLDPEFAMARIGLARVAYAKTDVATALQHMEQALAHPDRLSDRERLAAAALSSLVRWEPDFIDKWAALSELYPDYHVAAFNTAYGLHYANRFPEMRGYANRASDPMAITRPVALHYRGLAELPMGLLAEADKSFALAAAAGFPAVFIEPAFTHAARRQFEQASAMVDAVEGPPQVAIEKRVMQMTFAADQGRWGMADQLGEQLIASFKQPTAPFEWAARVAALAVHKRTRPDAEVQVQARRLLEQAQAALADAPGRARESVANAALYAAYVAAGMGDAKTAQRGLALVQATIDQAPAPVLANMAAIVRAQIDLQAGDPAAAIEHLQPFTADSALLLTRLVRARALQASAAGGQKPQELTKTLAWRARAYGEWAAERPPVLEALSPPRRKTD